MLISKKQKVVFFGCPLDCDEKHDAIEEKQAGAAPSGTTDDPLDNIVDLIRQEVPTALWETKGSLPVPDWLRPLPQGQARQRLVVDEFIKFIDQDGCRQAASEVDDFATQHVLPDLPCMIAVDHSLTGGVFKALARCLGEKNISLIIVDSHTDAIPMPQLGEAIQYDIDNNPNSVYDRNDPFLYDRTDSYNASSFIHHLLEERTVMPVNLYLIGVSDYPEKRSMRLKDPRIARYTGIYSGLKRQGAKLITKEECLTKPTKLKTLLKNIKTPYLYVSIDMDIGARNALEGVRFRNWKGLAEKQIYKLIDLICDFVPEEIQLAGMDIMEINPRRAGGHFPSGQDRTYRIATNLIKRIAFNFTG
ncbi:MAG: arginase family protein [Desulfobacterales bacterium]|jgi:arginase family enzyme